MLSKSLAKALNDHINAELWSSYLYLSMAAQMAKMGFAGFANWFSVQSKEEHDHGMILINYLISRGNGAELQPITKVPNSWKTPFDALKDTLDHERKVTQSISNLYGMASDERDYATVRALEWFVSEQVEEEESVQGLIDKATILGGGSGPSLYMLDNELSTRAYTQTLLLATKVIK